MKEYYLNVKLRLVTVNKNRTFQFDRTEFGHGFSIMGHFSLPKIQLTSDNSREANSSSDIQIKQWRGRTSAPLCSGSKTYVVLWGKKEMQQNKNTTGILFTAGTIKIRIVINIIANLVLRESRNLTAYLCTCCWTVSIWLHTAEVQLKLT